MKSHNMVIIWVAIITLALAGPTQGSNIDAEAYEIMTGLQELLRSDTNIASYTMRVETPDWQRTLRFDSWDDRLGKRLFIRVVSPKKDKNTAYLKRDGNLWMYLPKLERKIRIPPSMMLSSWMGSTFTFDDLIKVASVVDDYTHRVVARNEQSKTIESVPKQDAPVVWGKLVSIVTLDGIPVSQVFFDEDGLERRKLLFEDVREMDGRRIPTRWVMRPLDGSGKRTVLQLETVQFDPQIESSMFTQSNMQRRGQ